MGVRELKKGNRKARRALEIMQKDFPDILASESSEIIFIGNYGLSTEASLEELASLLVPFGSLEDIILLPGKSYSFARFETSSEATKAFQNLHGIYPPEKPLFMALVNSLPQQSGDEYDFLPPGLVITEDFVSDEEEAHILESIDWEKDSFCIKNRRVAHYGFPFIYGSNSINRKDPIRPIPPAWLNILPEKDYIDQCTVNRYEPGHSIPPHIDSHGCCGDPIFVLSLGSDIVMNFSKDESCHHVVVKRRSLMRMSGPSRYIYKHGISPRKSDVRRNEGGKLTLVSRGLRTSLTFRKSLENNDMTCQCAYPDYCDSRKNESIELNDKKAAKLESTHVHSVYDQIARHFSNTRHKPWPKVLKFLNSANPNSTLIDVGCGNGKYLGHHPMMLQVGCDYSSGLLQIVKERKFDGVRCDILNLPFRSDLADIVICIAVIHHLSTLNRRKRALQEIRRILKIGGRALIYAWAKEQNKDDVPSSYLKHQNYSEPPKSNPDKKCDTKFPMVLPVHKNRTNFQHADLLVPWKSKNSTEDKAEENEEQTYHRFYHVFDEVEFLTLVESIEGLKIEKVYYDQGNWCAIIEKGK